ncbi:polyprenyl synthetase family protein [Corynebacterium aquilae]|uniref:polyprenyl synthetase family protein n=1 Tax=Corynebacterium aquilae TaxID=203263 RepID=UPI000950DD3F|nr:polyprenyl synthetase family protein [Corynebacterium aquilae]
MQLPDSPFHARVEQSCDFLRTTFDDTARQLAELSPDAAAACQHVKDLALGGKHIRSLLTHVAADRPADQPTPGADISVAAAFDLLHSAFLLVDDIIDDDDIRRGRTTLHAYSRKRALEHHGINPANGSAATHYGRSVAVLAGMAAQNVTMRVVLESGAPTEVTAHLLKLFSHATGSSIAGEFMDIHHSLPDVHPTAHDIATTNRLKTSIYSFEAPLIAGRLLAGGGMDDVAHATTLGRDLGAAYQLADDIRDVYASGEETGKATGGSDLSQKRATALISFATTTDAWPTIEKALDQHPVDTTTIATMLRDCGALHSAQQAIDQHLHDAHTTIEKLQLSTAATDLLHHLADNVGRSHTTVV